MDAHPFWTDRLSEALDGTLSPTEARALDEHLAGCEPCRRVREELAEVRRRARALPAPPPETDLWDRIAPALREASESRTRREDVIPLHAGREPADSSPAREPGRIAATPRSRSGLRALRRIAAAILLVGAGGVGGAIWSARTDPTPDRAANGAPLQEEPVPLLARETVEPGLVTELRRLEEALRMDLDRLDPGTRAVILANLETIDRAIRESVGALESDPESGYLRSHLGSALERKVGYLQSVTRLLES